MIKLVAFDWNGTLFSDTKAAWESSNKTLGHYGHKPISLLQYQKTFDIPLSKFWLANGGKKKDLQDLGKKQNNIFNDFYEPRANKVRSRGGVKKILKRLKKQQIKAIIYSNHTKHGIDFQLKRLKIEKLFSHVTARTHSDGSSQVHSRSKEQKLLKYIKSSGLKHFEVLTIGDTPEEIEIGKRHKFYTVAISGGFSTIARLKKHKPDFLIHNMKDLISIVKKLNN